MDAKYLDNFIKLDWYPTPPSDFPEEGKKVLKECLLSKLPTAIGFEKRYGYFILNSGPVIKWQQHNPILKVEVEYKDKKDYEPFSNL